MRIVKQIDEFLTLFFQEKKGLELHGFVSFHLNCILKGSSEAVISSLEIGEFLVIKELNQY